MIKEAEMIESQARGSAAAPQPQPAPQPALGGQQDYSAQWAEYYRSVGRPVSSVLRSRCTLLGSGSNLPTGSGSIQNVPAPTGSGSVVPSLEMSILYVNFLIVLWDASVFTWG